MLEGTNDNITGVLASGANDGMIEAETRLSHRGNGSGRRISKSPLDAPPTLVTKKVTSDCVPCNIATWSDGGLITSCATGGATVMLGSKVLTLPCELVIRSRTGSLVAGPLTCATTSKLFVASGPSVVG